MKFHWLLPILMIILVQLVRCQENGCSRSRSRVAQSILDKSFLAIMQKEGLSPDTECLLMPERNMYWDNERHKWSELANNWNCLYCGKSFYNEHHIDNHYDNRHSNTVLRGPEAVCLADHCDYLRCDIISSAKKTSFWEEALCKQKDLLALKKKCQNIMKACVPTHISDAEKKSILEKLDNAVCSFLTCENYWENPYKEVAPTRTAAYFIAAIFTVFGFIMYYCLACSHLFSDEKFLGDSDGLIRERSKVPDSRRYVSYPAEGQSIRNRQGMIGDR
ncbi:uncharacterized protein LOC121408008 [Lytechinus variegatus]|uniref:uncharacterized protein LOC121408008 n=1 Tax=Lytechinus variegatus TaxID=7654 RepID=UPI001BB0E658|nr:uncharacterized protein LOC121408008 [Lytechinus variegatus]